MAITLSFNAETPQEVAAQLSGFFALLHKQGTPTTEPITQTAGDVIEGTATEVKEPEPAPKERKKREPKKAAEPEAADPENEKKSDAKPASVDDVREALKKMASAKGEDAVWNLLEKYKAKSASTVPEDKRADLVAEVTKECGE